jgi:hypothetical protein
VKEMAWYQPQSALTALAESIRLAQRIARSGRYAAFGAASVIHRARGRADLATAALSAYDAYVTSRDLQPWATAEVSDTRARLHADEVAAAAAVARGTPVDELIDRLILDHAAPPHAAADGGTPAVRAAP